MKKLRTPGPFDGFLEACSNFDARGEEGEALQPVPYDLTNAIVLDEDGWSFDQRGAAYLSLGRYDLAVNDFNKAFELDEGDAWALYARGIAKKRNGDPPGGDADMAAGRTLRSDIAAQLATDGIRP